MKLTTEETESYSEQGQLIVERSLKQQKDRAEFNGKTIVKEPEMTEDTSVVSAGGDEERKEFEMKMLLKRQDPERKMLKNKINDESAVEGLINGVKNCCLNKEEEELTGKLSHLSLKTSTKRQEPREDDERGDDCLQTEDEGKEKTDILHDQQLAILDEPTPLHEPTKEEADKNKKAVPRKPGNGVAVYPNKNNAYQQQMAFNDPNSLAWNNHHYQQQQQQQHHQQRHQQAIQMPANFPNYDGLQQQDQYNGVANTGMGSMHQSKRGYDCEVQDMYSEAPKYFRPPQMPQDNLDALSTPLSPTSFSKPVSTVCTKQMAGATLLQQNNPPVPLLSPTQQQPQPNWNLGFPLHQQQQQQINQPLHHHQQQQLHQFDNGLQPDFYLPNDLGSDFNLLGDALITDENAVGDVVGDIDENEFDILLDNVLATHKGQDQGLDPKDLDSTLYQQQCFLPKASSPPTAINYNNSSSSTLNTNSMMALHKNNNQEDTGYATDQSPSHDSQFSPQSVMEGSPAASSSISTSPPRHQNWSPPPSNLSEMSQDSGVCSPMSEDGKYGQIKSPRSVSKGVTENNLLTEIASPSHYNTSIAPLRPQQTNDPLISSQTSQQPQEMAIVPPLPDSMLRLEDMGNLEEAFNFNSQMISDFLDSHQEDLNDVVSVLKEDVSKMIEKNLNQNLRRQQQQQQQQVDQSHLMYQQHHQQQQQQQPAMYPQQQPQIATNPQNGLGTTGFVGQVQHTTNIASGSGGVMLKNNCPSVASQPISQPSTMMKTRPAVMPTTTVGNGKMMPAPPVNNVKNTATPAPSTSMATPPPNAMGKLPIPPTPRRNQGATPMLGFPNNGPITTLIVFNPSKPRLPNIAPKDPTKHANDSTCSSSNIAGNNKKAAANTASSNYSNNGSPVFASNASPPATHHAQPIVANGNAGNIPPNANGLVPQQNSVANRTTTKRLNCARKSVAKLVREDLEYTDREGDTNLHVAVCRTDRTDPYLIKALLERLEREDLTSMINAQNNAGQTPLYLAVSSNDANKVKVLVDHGADVTLYAESNDAKEKMAAIHCAASRGQGYLDTLKALLTAPGIQVDQVDLQGHTALHRAILCHGEEKGDNQQVNSLPIIEALVMAGANPNLQVQNGRTALMFALETSNLDVFEKLFSMVKPENREKCLKTQDVKGNSVLKIAERLKTTLPPGEQQRLQNCLRRSIYQRSNGLLCGNVNVPATTGSNGCR